MRNAKLILLCGVAATLTAGSVAPALADGYERPRAARKAPAKPKPAAVPLAGERTYYRDRVVEKIVEVPGQPSGLGFMPNGDLLILVHDRILLYPQN